MRGALQLNNQCVILNEVKNLVNLLIVNKPATKQGHKHLSCHSRAGGNPEGSREVDSGSEAGMTYRI